MLMDKEIYEHRDFVTSELTRIDKIKDQNAKIISLNALLQYHDMQVKNFQHERLIHLIVTVTFAFIAIGAWAALYGWLMLDEGRYDMVTILLIILTLILTVLEGFYVRFYYHLENRTQKLYALGTKVYQAMQKSYKQ